MVRPAEKNLGTNFEIFFKLGGRGDRKQMQFFAPAFMIASQVGWYLLAFKLVSVLALKALFVAKIAFLAAAIATLNRLMVDPLRNG